MEVLYGLIPGMILLGLIAVAVFFWAAKSGQFDDLDGAAHRILMDEEVLDPPPPRRTEREAADEPGEGGGAEPPPGKPPERG